MKEYYSVEELQQIIQKDSETILRYIRSGVIKDQQMIAAFFDHNIINRKDYNNGPVYLTLEELESIQKEAFTPKKSDSDEELVFKKRLKHAYCSLILENPNSKPYRISGKSILLLLQRRFKKTLADALKMLGENEVPPTNADTIPANTSVDNTYETEEAQGCHHSVTSDMCPICKAFNDQKGKEKFIKGLYLLQNIDGKISEEEAALINDRAKRLGITEEQIKNWVPDPKNLDRNEIVPQIKFENMDQAVVFLLEAIRLAYQDGNYTEDERILVNEFAANNAIPLGFLQKYEEIIKNDRLEQAGEAWHLWQKA